MIPVADGISMPLELDGTIGEILSFIKRCLWLVLARSLIGAETGYV